jgi:glycosyltransferase involved in cell wall biosynthesis
LNTLYPPYGAAGAETTLRLLAAQMMDRGHDCNVVTLTPGRQAEAREIDGIPVHYIPLANVFWPHGASKMLPWRVTFQTIEAYNPVMKRRLTRLLQRLSPEVVNFHNLQGFSASAWSAAQDLRIPIVQTLHDYYTACPRSAMWRPGQGNCASLCSECRVFSRPRRAMSGIPDAVTCVSNRVFDRLTKAGAFPRAVAGQQPIRIIRGNNAADALPDVAPPVPRVPLRLGFMGRLDPSKGLENLIDAVRRLPEGAASLRIAGTGRPDYTQALHARAAGVAGISFLGHAAPPEFFPSIDLLVIPSIWEDPFPRVFHEALAYGVPSLATPLGGLSEVVEHGRNGFLMAGADAEALFASLSELIGASWDRGFVFAECRKAAADFMPSRISAEYEAVLLAAAARRPVPEGAGALWRGAVAQPCHL